MLNEIEYIKEIESNPQQKEIITRLNIADKEEWFCQKDVCEFTKNEILKNLVVTEENIHLLEKKHEICTDCSEFWG